MVGLILSSCVRYRALSCCPTNCPKRLTLTLITRKLQVCVPPNSSHTGSNLKSLFLAIGIGFPNYPVAFLQTLPHYYEVGTTTGEQLIVACPNGSQHRAASSQKSAVSIACYECFTPAVCRSCVGHFFQSYWTKELSIGKLQIGKSGQFGSGVGPRRKHNRNNLKQADILVFQPCFPCFGNDEVGSSILPSSTRYFSSLFQ